MSRLLTFVPKMTGQYYNPHVSTGVAPKEYLDQMLAEPFEPFTFSPAGAAVFQLGPVRYGCKKTESVGFEALMQSFAVPLSWLELWACHQVDLMRSSLAMKARHIERERLVDNCCSQCFSARSLW
jgi:hypothetical protein